MGVHYDRVGSAHLTTEASSMGVGVELTGDGGISKSFSWTETSVSLTNNGATEGSATLGKIFSTTF